MATAPEGRFHGRPIRRRAVGGFRILELFYRPGYDAGLHSHGFAHLALSVSGAYDERLDGREVLCDASTTIYRPAGVTHFSRNRDCLNRVFAVEIRPEALGTEASVLRLDEPHTSQGALTVAMKRLQAESMRDDPFSNMALYGLLLETLAEFGRDRIRSHTPSWLAIIDEAIRDSREVPTVGELAQLAQVSETTFTRQFRQHFNTSVGQYARRRRLEKAVRLLERSDLSLAEIAFETGFVDQSHFTNAFKGEFGITPNRYRKAKLL